MQQQSRTRGRTTRLVLAGIALLFLGIPFLGSALMAFLLSGSLAVGIPVSLGVLVVIYALSGFQGSLVAAATAAAIAISWHLDRGIRTAAALACAAAVIAALLGAGYGPGFMTLSSTELEPLVPVYTAAGFGQQEIERMFALVDYLSPGIGAVQVAGGAVLAAFFASWLLSSARGWKAPKEKRFSLGFPVIWMVAGCLALNVLGYRFDSMNPEIIRAGRNILVFLVLPFALLGGAISREYIKLSPQMLIPGALMLVFAPPVFLLGIVVLGILDAWFDFRSRIEARIERMKNEGSSG